MVSPLFRKNFVNCCRGVSPHLLDQFRGDVAPPNEDPQNPTASEIPPWWCGFCCGFFLVLLKKGVKAHNKGILYNRIWVSGTKF